MLRSDIEQDEQTDLTEVVEHWQELMSFTKILILSSHIVRMDQSDSWIMYQNYLNQKSDNTFGEKGQAVGLATACKERL